MTPLAALKIDRDRPDARAIDRAAEVIRRGGIVLIPTETLYGFAADPWNANAVARIIAIKRRADDKGMPVLVGDLEFAHRLARGISPSAEQLIEQHWPGALTIVVAAHPLLPREVAPDGVALRWTACPAAAALASAAGGAITATSANRSGDTRPALDPDLIAAEFGSAIDLILDAGPLPPSLPSTVVDGRTDPPVVLRAGAVRIGPLFGQLPTDRG
ncbi:MAG: L-threonylcarbamoyladenylate synthase [bacterium]